jgi:3-deoxy-manno-octulosonate cytidylyltransferase (CMP-KDO synthetase)
VTGGAEDLRIAAIIPARMGSSRFPGKPLVKVRGIPMVEHVRRRAELSRAFSSVVVATCDVEIADTVRGFGGQVLMTSPAHQAATDRVAEAMTHLECTHVVNVQGDEILVVPADLARMAQAMGAQLAAAAWNAVARIEHVDELADSSVVKCVVSRSGRVLFCSRDFSRLPVAPDGFEPIRRILGILGYRRGFLEAYATLGRTPLELAESIDQSRVIEHDVALQGVEFSRGYPGVNEPRELDLVERLLDDDPLQRATLGEVLRA